MDFACFSDDTEVYTINGWEKFSDIEGKWQITPVLSLDPDTFNVEWIYPINYIKYHYKGEMIHFNSKIMDSMVTPDHQSFIGKRSNQYDRTYRKWVLKDSKNVKKDHTFYSPITFKKKICYSSLRPISSIKCH